MSQTRKQGQLMIQLHASASDAGSQKSRRASYVLGVALALMTLEGFDQLCITFVSADLLRELRLVNSQLGMLFTAGVFGSMVGSVAFGPLGDRWGRKPLIIVTAALFGLGTALIAFAATFEQLAILRLMAGLGLGGCLPNILSLLAESAPVPSRTKFLMWATTAQLAGGAIAGPVSRALANLAGWRCVFLAGGLVTLCVLPFAFGLPETTRDGGHRRTQECPDGQSPSSTRSLRKREGIRAWLAQGLSPIAQHKLVVSSLLLWLAIACNLLMWVTLVYWLPSLLHEKGMVTDDAALAASAFNVGGVVAGLTIASLVGRVGLHRVLCVTAPVASVAVFLIGESDTTFVASTVLVLMAGFFAQGTYSGFTSLATLVYPAEIRSAGVGVAMSVGRIGSTSAPLLASFVLQITNSSVSIFYMAAGFGLLSWMSILLLTYRPTNGWLCRY